MGVPGAVACLGHVPAAVDWVPLASAGEPRVGARPVTVSYKSGAGATVQDTTTSGGSSPTASASANAGEAPYRIWRLAHSQSAGRPCRGL